MSRRGPNRRHDPGQAMSAFTDDELIYLLAGDRLARVATVGADGTPHGRIHPERIVPWGVDAAARLSRSGEARILTRAA